MAGFVLKNTLSDNGGVTRGICKMDDQNNLTEVVETQNIVKTVDGAAADGTAIDTESLVSMNMWVLTPEFLDLLEEGFVEFFETEVPTDPLKAEFLIPTFIGELLDEKKMTIKVLRTNDIWYGMTYKEDVEAVKESFKGMIEDGVYEKDLFGDLQIGCLYGCDVIASPGGLAIGGYRRFLNRNVVYRVYEIEKARNALQIVKESIALLYYVDWSVNVWYNDYHNMLQIHEEVVKCHH